ncbi:MAG: hypothetical protein QNJ56_09900, partial [Gammaproteobacteria bacterium]|nr:hypothetical protein [Gammaproteobacteria bacterium]
WAHVFGIKTRLSMVLAIIAGQDEAVETDSPYSRDIQGLRLSFAYPITHRFNLFTSFSTTDSDYDSPFFDDTENRIDSNDDLSIGASWRVNKNWLLRAIVSSTENTSNVEIYDYDRDTIMLTARSDFFP